MSIFPNPVNDELTISVSQDIIKDIQILDITGKVIKEISSVNKNEIIINVDYLQTGTYVVKISTDKFVFHENIIKK